MNQTYKIADFIGRELPPEILEQLKIVGRVKQFIKPTSTSAISQAEDKPEIPSDPSLSTQREIQDDISKLIDDVKDFEDQVAQLEDLADEHLKDLAIPPANTLIADAVNQLGGDDGVITKDVLDKAMAIMDYFPMMSLGQDPVLAALTGDGILSGPRLGCNEITSSLGKQLKLKPRTVQAAEAIIEDQGSKIQEQHNKKMQDLAIELILMLWWNQLWPKFVVDLTIINPARQMVANPSDTIICFFKRMCGRSRFRRKPKECVQGTASKSFTDAQGPLNKLLNRLRKFLICKLPYKFYKEYKPSIDTKCPPEGPPSCPPEAEGSDISAKNVSDMGAMFDDIGDSVPCFGLDDLSNNGDTTVPTMFGCSPDCVKAAKIVIDAVQADAYSPPQVFVDTYADYKKGNV
jgi:hypothetical protein